MKKSPSLNRDLAPEKKAAKKRSTEKNLPDGPNSYPADKK
jgi:hypothetical protein